MILQIILYKLTSNSFEMEVNFLHLKLVIILILSNVIMRIDFSEHFYINNHSNKSTFLINQTLIVQNNNIKIK